MRKIIMPFVLLFFVAPTVIAAETFSVPLEYTVVNKLPVNISFKITSKDQKTLADINLGGGASRTINAPIPSNGIYLQGTTEDGDKLLKFCKVIGVSYMENDIYKIVLKPPAKNIYNIYRENPYLTVNDCPQLCVPPPTHGPVTGYGPGTDTESSTQEQNECYEKCKRQIIAAHKAGEIVVFCAELENTLKRD